MKNKPLERLTEAQKDLAKNLRKEGLTLEEIALKLNVSRQRIHQIVSGEDFDRGLTQTERIVASEYREKGWMVLRRGFPDFFCFNPMDGEYEFVEVKVCSDISKQQRLMFEYLKKAGIKAKIKRVYLPKGLTNDWRYNMHPINIKKKLETGNYPYIIQDITAGINQGAENIGRALARLSVKRFKQRYKTKEEQSAEMSRVRSLRDARPENN